MENSENIYIPISCRTLNIFLEEPDVLINKKVHVSLPSNCGGITIFTKEGAMMYPIDVIIKALKTFDFETYFKDKGDL